MMTTNVIAEMNSVIKNSLFFNIYERLTKSGESVRIYPSEIATVYLTYPIMANRHLAKFGIGFRSTGSNWCPLLVPSVGATWSFVTFQACKRAVRKSRLVHLRSSLITLCMDTFCVWLLAYAIKWICANMAGFCKSSHILLIMSFMPATWNNLQQQPIPLHHANQLKGSVRWMPLLGTLQQCLNFDCFQRVFSCLPYRNLNPNNREQIHYGTDSTTPFAFPKALPQVMKQQVTYQRTPTQLPHSQISVQLYHQMAKNNQPQQIQTQHLATFVASSSIKTLCIPPQLISSTTALCWNLQFLLHPAYFLFASFQIQLQLFLLSQHNYMTVSLDQQVPACSLTLQMSTQNGEFEIIPTPTALKNHPFSSMMEV